MVGDAEPEVSDLMAAIDHVPDSVVLLIVMAVVIAVCWFENRRLRPASPGPDAEEASRDRQGASPTEAGVVSPRTHLDAFADAFTTQLEHPPGCDRHHVLSTKNLAASEGVSTKGLSSVAVRSTAEAGASAFIYRWVRPEDGKRLEPFGWTLEHVDPRYGTWLIQKVERWP